MKKALEIKLIVFVAENGKSPFSEWLSSLKDSKTKARIQARIARLREGNFGDIKSVGQGVYELRIVFGPGYRVYFGKLEDSLVLLLCGGSKGSQKMDIKMAQRYFSEFRESKKNEK